jgi:hypothetical protein
MFNWPTMTYLSVAILVATYVLFTIWVLIRGWFDLLFMLAELRREPVDLADDGRVRRQSDVPPE